MTLGHSPGSGTNKKNDGLVYQLLTPDLSGALELLWIEYGPGATTAETPFTHQGEECGVILEGRLEVHVGETSSHARSRRQRLHPERDPSLVPQPDG